MVRLDEGGVERVPALGAAEPGALRLVAQQARHPRERLEMVGAGGVGREQHEHQIDRTVVHRVEADGRLEAGEQPPQAVDFGELGVRDGDPEADSRAAEALALQQRVEDAAFADSGESGRRAGDFLQRLLLAGRLQSGQHGFAAQQRRELHHARSAGSSQPILPSSRR